ncbi:WXG100 family type VII secretion target [Kutzneria chonburiensis]|uniref:ESAT-6-like protein n=1 Tax=Kutzneria chonburiensis TaxID=1483604 RepID=A0ABV6N770_9PSEU|nr:WXG100 family type VII secretion target [Kutzneria chonburiensis]
MASYDGSNVDTDAMRGGARTISTTSNQIQGVRTKVDHTMQDLFVSWQSDAAVVFQDAMGAFDQTVQSIMVRLNRLSEDVVNAAQQYDHRDQDNTSGARNAAGAIGGLSNF